MYKVLNIIRFLVKNVILLIVHIPTQLNHNVYKYKSYHITRLYYTTYYKHSCSPCLQFYVSLHYSFNLFTQLG